LVGFVVVAFAPPDDRFGLLLDAAIRALAAAAVFFAFRWIYQRLRGREGIGLGDVKLAGVAGLWLSWSGFSIAIEIAALSALGVFAARQRMKARAFRPTVKIPFGAFLAPAIWLCWLLEALGYIG
jgi:leader peptidase (prepilin peptidase)/N-methyltransferase